MNEYYVSYNNYTQLNIFERISTYKYHYISRIVLVASESSKYFVIWPPLSSKPTIYTIEDFINAKHFKKINSNIMTFLFSKLL